MTTLTQSMLDSLANQTFSVTTDYTMNGATLIFNGMTILFNGGTISNGTMQLSNCTLAGVATHSINATVVGTLTNSTIYSSWFTRIGQMKFNYTGKTINFDENATILDEDDTVKIDQVNHVTFNGMFNTFTCYANFFEIYDDCSYIEIMDFKATAVGASVYEEDQGPHISFVKMGTNLPQSVYNQASSRTHLNVHNNEINKFNVGISLGADVGARIENSNVYNNRIIETVGTEHGYGYGIHLANAYYCQVYNNYLEKTTRHSIYHAWGTNNSIKNNTIRWHWKGVLENIVNPSYQPSAVIGNVRAAIALYRHSEDIIVKNNAFFDSYNASIHIHSFPDDHYNSISYGTIDNITIESNFFQHTIVHDPTDGYHEHKYPAIVIGYPLQYCTNYFNILNNNNWYIDHVDIINNRLVSINSDYTNFCRLYQCKHLKIEDNDIIFSACSITSGILVCRLINFDTANLLYSVEFTASVKNNTFRNTNLQLPTNVEMSIFSNVSELFNSNNYVITILNNTLYNQVLNGIQMYQLYYNYIALTDPSTHPNFILQLET